MINHMSKVPQLKKKYFSITVSHIFSKSYPVNNTMKPTFNTIVHIIKS